MGNGTHREFDRGVASSWVIGLQLVLGTAFLVLAGLGAVRMFAVWRGHPRAGGRLVRWSLLALAVWLLWAFVRVGQYAS